jgi:putative transposase
VLVRKGSHSVFSIQLHFVFVTKYRKKVINAPILDRMHEIFANICVKTNCILIEFSGEQDHACSLVGKLPPR